MGNAATSPKARLAYIDWMRGLACLLMFQTHCYDSWLSPEARKSTFFMYSQLLGTLPAPLFLFLAGISFALVTDKLRKKDAAAGEIARTTIKRGAEIFGLGLLFRLQQYLFNWRWAPWTDLLRVDILNTIGLSMMLMGVLCWMVAFVGRQRAGTTQTASERNQRLRVFTIIAAMATAIAISLLTPPLWTTHRLNFLPWPIESYINGVHTFAAPKGWFFPVFPWAAFAFAGLAVGFLLLSDWAKRHEGNIFAVLGATGIGSILLSRWLDRLPHSVYAAAEYWTTSPVFLLMRVGLLLTILCIVYAWCRWGAAQWGWSPVIQLGQASLLVYWVHIEFVYDRLNILPSHGNDVPRATMGLVFIAVFMVVLAAIRTRTKGRSPDLLAKLRSAPRPVTS